MAAILEDRRVAVVLCRIVNPPSPSLALLAAYERAVHLRRSHPRALLRLHV
jgi:hypothetical protein